MKAEGGYMGRLLRVDLTRRTLADEELDKEVLQDFIGGAGLAAKLLYHETPPGIDSFSPENRLILTTGPLNGTVAPGSGTYNVTSKGPLIGGFAACSHANGYFGARLKFAGYDGIVVQGVSDKWSYLLIRDGQVEIRDAGHLLGKDTYETEDQLKAELKLPRASIACIGPAGENLALVACIASDKGHIAANGGLGAVMGAKKLKAIVVSGNRKVPVKDPDKLRQLIPRWTEEARKTGLGRIVHEHGTAGNLATVYKEGWLPVRNLTGNIFPEYERFTGQALRAEKSFELKRAPCYACPLHHCHRLRIISGPHAGLDVEEPEYEVVAQWSSNIGCTDLGSTLELSNLVDRLGMDANGAGFAVSLALECYEKGLISKQDTEGLDLAWGNVDAIRQLLIKMARREGFGTVLCDGPMLAAQRIGKEAPNFAVHLGKGNAPHGHDPRAAWGLLFSQGVSDNSSIQGGSMMPTFDPEGLPQGERNSVRFVHFRDCLVVCMFVYQRLRTAVESLNAVTGFELTPEDALTVGERTANLLRLFNIRNGLTPKHDTLSPRLREAPVEGPAKGKSIEPYYDQILRAYYREMGWDEGTGKPLHETLHRLGLEEK